MLRKLLVVGVFTTLLAAGAQAATSGTSIGPRVGFSIDPDQIVFGGQITTGEVAPRLTFDPSLEIGLGSDVLVLAFNLDLHYHFNIQNSDWRPYAGAGLGIAFINVDHEAPIPDDSETGVGGGIVLGAAVPTSSGNQFFGELRFGLGDEMPGLKLMVGWNFKM